MMKEKMVNKCNYNNKQVNEVQSSVQASTIYIYPFQGHLTALLRKIIVRRRKYRLEIFLKLEKG